MSQIHEHQVEVVDSQQTGTAIEAITRGELDMQIRTARAFPRSIVKFKRDALSMACISVETAKSCMYSVPRSGKQIVGPSVRLAEICASAFGHLRITARCVGDDGKFVTSQGECWDIENNVAARIEVMRRVTNKDGRRYSDDMIGNTVNAANSIALRNAILRIIPRAYIDSVFLEVKRVAVGDAKTLDVRRDGTVNELRKMGVTDDRILHAVDKQNIGDIGLDDIATLFGLINRVREDEEDIEVVFPAPPKDDAGTKHDAGKSKADKINDKLGGTGQQNQAPASPAPETGAEATGSASAPPAKEQSNAAPTEGAGKSWKDLSALGIMAVIEPDGIAVQRKEGETLLTLRPDGKWDAGFGGWTVQPNSPEQDLLARQMAEKFLPAATQAATAKTGRPGPAKK